MATARPIPDVAPVTSALEAWVSGSIRAALFAFGASSSLYIATHPEQTVFRLDAAGNRTTVAGPEQGAVGTTRARSGARRAMRTRFTSRRTAVWSRPTKAPFKRRSCSASRLARWAGLWSNRP